MAFLRETGYDIFVVIDCFIYFAGFFKMWNRLVTMLRVGSVTLENERIIQSNIIS